MEPTLDYNGNTETEAMLLRGLKVHGDKFDPSDLVAPFGRYFNTGERIKVRYKGDGTEATGTVGVTTGWKPSWLLMRTRTAFGSSFVLSDRYEVVAVKRDSRYVEVT